MLLPRGVRPDARPILLRGGAACKHGLGLDGRFTPSGQPFQKLAASERTKPEEEDEAQAVAEVGADRQPTEDCSFVRTEAAPESGQGWCEETSPLTLVDLFSLVRDMGGKIVRSDGGFAVQNVENPRLTPRHTHRSGGPSV